MKGGFNTSFVEIRTFEGEKFIRDLRPGEAIKTRTSYELLGNVFQRQVVGSEPVFNIYYHGEKEGVLNRISGWQKIYTLKKLWTTESVLNIRKGDIILLYGGIKGVVEKVERMETRNRFFYKPYLEKGVTTYYADNVCIFG